MGNSASLPVATATNSRTASGKMCPTPALLPPKLPPVEMIAPVKAQALLEESLRFDSAKPDDASRRAASQEFRKQVFLHAFMDNPDASIDTLLPDGLCQELELASDTALLLLRDTLVASAFDVRRDDNTLSVVTRRNVTFDDLANMLVLFPYKSAVQSISFAGLVLQDGAADKALHGYDWRIDFSGYPALTSLNLRGMKTSKENMNDLFNGIDGDTERRLKKLTVDASMLEVSGDRFKHCLVF